MRMSDWSSDVCSSDLVGDLEEQAVEGVELEVVEHLVEGGDVEVEAATIIFGADFERIDILRLEDQILEARRPQDGPDAAGAPGERRAVAVEAAARKSVVKGKSVTVRVDIGGRRLIKNNKHPATPYDIKSHVQYIIQ